MLKINAFTLFEMLIAANLIVIILAFAFNIFIKSQSLIAKIDKSLFTKTELESFLYAFQNDLYKSKQVEVLPNEIRFVNHNKLIEYSFTQDFIFRQSTKTDSFKIGNAEIKSSAYDEFNYVIQLQIPLRQKFQNFYFHKVYSCAELMGAEKK